jgi:hypothetical protein
MAMIPDSLVLLAGFALAHAAWSVSDLPAGERLVPLAVVAKDGRRQLLRFEARTQEEAIAQAKAALAQRQPELDAWAFVREGVMAGGAGKVDALSVDAWAKRMGQPITFVQEFIPYSSGAFRVRGDALAVVDGRALAGAEAARLVEKLYEGVRQHPKAGQLWPGWRIKR